MTKKKPYINDIWLFRLWASVKLPGSSAFAKEYKEYVKNKLIINFDCVSDVNDIFFFPTKQIKNDQSKHENIINAFASTDYIRVHINKGFGFYPSDNFNFKYAYGVCSLKKGLFYYLDRIHTSRDIIFNEENIELLSDGVYKLIKTTHTSRWLFQHNPFICIKSI